MRGREEVTKTGEGVNWLSNRTNSNSHAEQDRRRVANQWRNVGDGCDAAEDGMPKCGARKESWEDESAPETCKKRGNVKSRRYEQEGSTWEKLDSQIVETSCLKLMILQK